MRPAKIGQLTPIDNRSRLIDRLSSLSAGVPVVPSVQRAWFSGRDGTVCFGDAYSSGSKDNCGAVISTKCQVDVVCCSSNVTTTNTTTPSLLTFQGLTARTNNSLYSEIPKSDDNSTEKGKSIHSQLSALDSVDIGEVNLNINKVSCKIEQCSISDGGNRSHGYQFVDTRNQVSEKINLSSTLSDTTIDEDQSVDTIGTSVQYGDSERVCYKTENTIDVSNRNCENNSNDGRLFYNDTCNTSFHWRKYQRSLLAGDQSNSDIDMNIKDVNSCVYANYFDIGNPSNSVEEHQQETCLRSNTRNEQILSINTVDCHKNRLSHQYLNSHVTSLNCPNSQLEETGPSYPYLHTDSEFVASSDLNPQSRMVVRAKHSEETSVIDTRLDQHLLLSPSHHYYNKSTILKPFSSEPSVSVNKFSSNQCDFKPDCFMMNKCSNHGRETDDHIDLMFSPKLSNPRCPVHKSSQLSPPFRQHHYHSLDLDHEQQQLLDHSQPLHNDRTYTQEHHHYRHYSINSVSSLIPNFRCGHHRAHIFPVSLLWTVLSVLVAGTCLLSFLTPYWTVHPDHVHSFGLFNLCIRDQRYSQARPLCINFGHQHHYYSTHFSIAASKSNVTSEDIVIDTGSVDIARIPSGAWQAACLLFGVGVFVHILGASVSLAVLALREPWHHRVAIVNGYMQTVGVLLLIAGLLLYPVGFSSPFYSYYCDSSRPFRAGHCSMGWSWVTAIMSTALSIFCPVMSSFVEAQHTTRKTLPVVETATP